VLVERLSVRQAAHALFVRGLPKSPVRSLVVRGSSFHSVANGSLLSGVADLLLCDVAIQPGRPAETRKEP
jgi:hypothetical protein